MERDLVCRPRGETLLREVEGRHLLVPIRGNCADMETVFVLNEVGAFIWRHLDGRRSDAAIACLAAKRFAAPAEKVSGDVREFLVSTLAAGLVEKA